MAKPALKDFIITSEDFRLFRIEMNKLLNKNKIDQASPDENFPV